MVIHCGNKTVETIIMKSVKLILLSIFIFGFGCNKFKDEELSIQRKDFLGNELRTDGYYYSYYENNSSPSEESIITFFLYRNGVILSSGGYKKTNSDVLEKEMLERYELLQNKKTGWGVFIVKDNKIEYEQWSTSSGGGLPIFKSSYDIENDTTLISPCGNIYHFKQFSPKPDSINNFIK